MSKEFIENDFLPFTQETQGYTRVHEGNGLGLAVVREYCKINNIDLTIESQLNVGTKVKLIFKSS